MNCTSQPRMVHQMGWLRNTLKIKLLATRRGFLFFFLIPILTLVSIIFSSDKKAIAKR